MLLPATLRDHLVRIFAQAGQHYVERLKKAGELYPSISFHSEEAWLAHELPVVRAEILSDRKLLERLKLHLAETTVVPPTLSDEDAFEHAFLDLLEWIGVESIGFARPNGEELVAKLEDALDQEPTEVTLIPIPNLGLTSELGRLESVRLSDHVSFGTFDRVEEHFLRQSSRTVGRHYSAPGFAETLSSLGLRVERPLGVSADSIQKEVLSVLNSFRVFMMGFFRFQANVEFQFRGIKTSWHPWRHFSATFPSEYTAARNYETFGKTHIAFLDAKWPAMHPAVFERYTVTVNRLHILETRKFWQDKVIDLAIALESLLESESDLSHRIATVIPNALHLRTEDRRVTYDLLKEFYDLRSAIVHGESINSRRRLKRKFENMSHTDLEREFRQIEGIAQHFLRLHLLNERLRTAEGQQALLLGEQVVTAT